MRICETKLSPSLEKPKADNVSQSDIKHLKTKFPINASLFVVIEVEFIYSSIMESR